MNLTKTLFSFYMVFIISTFSNAQPIGHKFTIDEVLESIESLDKNNAIDFEIFTSAFKSNVFPYFNEQITAQLLYSKKQPWMDYFQNGQNGNYKYDQKKHRQLLADLIAQSRHHCIANTVISLNEVLTKHKQHFIQVIDKRYQKEVSEAQQAREWKKKAEEDGRKYYGRSPEPNPRSLYKKLTFDLTADYSQQMDKFWHELEKWQEDKEHNIHPIEAGFNIDLYKEPIRQFNYLYIDNSFELKWYQEALQRTGVKPWPNTECKVAPAYLAFKLGMRAEDVENGYLPPID